MKLRAWLDREGISNAEFGRLIGRSTEAVRRYALDAGDDKRIPDETTMPLIVRATNREVQPNDFYSLPELDDAATEADAA